MKLWVSSEIRPPTWVSVWEKGRMTACLNCLHRSSSRRWIIYLDKCIVSLSSECNSRVWVVENMCHQIHKTWMDKKTNLLGLRCWSCRIVSADCRSWTTSCRTACHYWRCQPMTLTTRKTKLCPAVAPGNRLEATKETAAGEASTFKP